MSGYVFDVAIAEFLAKAVYLNLLRLHLAMPRKALNRIVTKYLDSFTQDMLVNIQIPRRLRDTDAALQHQLHRLKLVLAAELSSLHSFAPVSLETP